MSEKRIKELANIEELEVEKSRCRRPEDPAADRSSEDATQVNAPDHEDEVQAATPITASRIILSMAATKAMVKERHCTASVVWRNMTTWNEEHETDKCGEGEIKNILMGESVVDVPTTSHITMGTGLCTVESVFP